MNETSRSLRRLGFLLNANALTDGQLCECFCAHQDDVAFEALMRRHGPMVLGVCRRILRNYHDAEEAFQATFLVLARKAKSIAPVHMVGNWLYGVAYRTARKAKVQVDKVRARERTMSVLPERSDGGPAAFSDLETLLDQELHRLPDKYRAPIILCELEGRTHKEVAKHLGWPEGTLSVRLMTAKTILANRLAGRKTGASGALLSALLCVDSASATVPPLLLANTSKAASAFAAGSAAAVGAVPIKVLALANGVLTSMSLTKVKSVFTMLVLVGIMGTGAAYSTQLLTTNSDKSKRADPLVPLAPRPDLPQEQPRVVPKEGLPPGAVARFGTAAFRTGQAFGSAMSPDGKSYYLRTKKIISVYDLETGLPLRRFPGAANFVASEPAKNSLALSPDGSVFAVGYLGRGSFLCDAKSGEKLRQLEMTMLENATFSPDGKKLIVNGNNKQKGVFVLDVATGKKDYTLAEGQGFLSQLLITPDGETLVTASSSLNPSIYVTGVRSKMRIHSLHVEGAQKPLIALSPDGKTLAITDERGNPLQRLYTMRFVDLASGQVRVVTIEHVPQKQPKAMLYSPDGASVVLALLDGTCGIVDVAGAKATESIPCGGSQLSFTPDGRRLVCLDGRFIRVWDFATAQELHAPVGPPEAADNIAFSPDGTILASWTDMKPIRCWSAATGELLATLEASEHFRERSAGFAPDGQFVSAGRNGKIFVWDMTTFTESARFHIPNVSLVSMGSLSASSDGRSLAAIAIPKPPLPANARLSPAAAALNALVKKAKPGDPNIRLCVWDLSNGAFLRQSAFPPPNQDPQFRFVSTTRSPRDLPILSPSGKSYFDRSEADVFVKDLLTDNVLVKLRCQPSPKANGADIVDPNFLEGPVRFSTDGQTAALAVSRLTKTMTILTRSDPHVAVFNLASGKELCRVPIDDLQPTSFVFAPEGRRVASIAGLNARMWDATTGQVAWETPDIGVEITAIAFSPDGNRLVTALGDTTMLVWDVSATKRRADARP